MWLSWEGQPRDRQKRALESYLGSLDRIRSGGASIAGFISRPQGSEVVALLYLAHLEPDERHTVRGLAETGFQGLTDRALFGFLGPGQRSALFVRAARANQAFHAAGHGIYFYFLNTGQDIARVEVPEWVALTGSAASSGGVEARTGSSGPLQLVQACVYDQCLHNSGYPYVLTRADEQAVILGEEREAFEVMLLQSMVRHGLLLPELSSKARQKQVARWRRSRR
jgi:hypothetical protein